MNLAQGGAYKAARNNTRRGEMRAIKKMNLLDPNFANL